MAWWKRFGRRAATLLLTVLMLLGTAAGEGADKTVINRINAPDVSADFAFAEDADLLEIIFPQILDCDAAFLRCGGETMLIDCATSGQAQRILNMFKQLGITHVDKIVNTHPHADHIGGFAELIKEITVDELWLCFPAEETVHCANAMKAAERAGVTVRMFGDGDTLTLGTATMQVWMLDKPEYTRLNDRSAQIMLTFGQRKMLFSADLEQKGQNGLIEKVGAEMLKADVLKYPHHGLQGLTPEYRAAVSPELAIVTCNQRETEGKKYIRRTALDTVWTVPGFIHLTTDGEQLVAPRRVGTVEQQQQRQRDLVFAQVVVRRLARLGAAREVEDVVLDLERHAQRVAEAAHPGDLFAVRAAGRGFGAVFLAMQHFVGNVQCRHDRDAVGANHLAAAADLAHLAVQVARGADQIVALFRRADDRVFLVEDLHGDAIA